MISYSTYGATWKKFSSGITVRACPPGYIYVPPLAPYTTRNFCVMKFEAKKDAAGMPESVESGTPWVTINRTSAQQYCQALGHGYDLMSNNEWQSIARNIAAIPNNWSTNIVGSGQINVGHSDNSPANMLAATTDDNDSCYATEETCSSGQWNSQRRTHFLSNGNIIWDFSGNASEWVSKDMFASPGSSIEVASFVDGTYQQAHFGALLSTICSSPAANAYCGMGYGAITSSAGGVSRGGAYTMANSGIFYVNLSSNATTAQATTGFRCSFNP